MMSNLDMKISKLSVCHLMMAYANAGDMDGVTNVSKRYENAGHDLSTATMNSSLTAILYGTELQHKTALKSLVAEIIKGSPIADRVSFSQAISACEKYGLLDEIAKLQKELASRSGLAKPDLNLAHSIISAQSIVETPVPPSVVQEVLLPTMDDRQESPCISCQIPTELLGEKSKADFLSLLRKYSQLGDLVSLEEIFKEYGYGEGARPLTPSLKNLVIRAYSANRDPKGAQRVVDEWIAAGGQINRDMKRILCFTYVSGCDPAGAERAVLDALRMQRKPGN